MSIEPTWRFQMIERATLLSTVATFALLTVALIAGCDDNSINREPALCASETSKSFVRPFAVDKGEYSFKSCAFETGYGKLHFFDEGPRDAKETILMVHGNPTWSFLYRKIAKAMIAKGHRVIAVDHLGMGMSDAPERAAFNYRPRSHSTNLEALIIAMDLKNVTILVQDWGGPIGLGVATRQPERISRMLIMNTWAWSVDTANPGLDHNLVSWGKQATELYKMDPLFGCNTMLTLTAEELGRFNDPGKGAMYKTIRDAYLQPAFDISTMKPLSAKKCAAMSNLAISILGDNAYQGEVEANLRRLRGKPYAVISGLRDQLFGALRCNAAAPSPCPGSNVCKCDPVFVLAGACDAPNTPATRFDFMCKSPNASLIEQNTDQWVQRLGTESLVARYAVPNAEHMVQEFAPDDVITALDKLLGAQVR
jgi:pimeloyl-ACP methyl ester carboxylesterase